MKPYRLHALPCLLAFASCATEADWRASEASAAEKIEVQFDATGRRTEVEYHILPEAVPAEVRAAMDALHPGGAAIAAEREYDGSTLYWELTKEIEGREVEAMFHPDGRLHSEEVEVDPSSVPSGVRDALKRRIDGQVAKWEEIRDEERQLVEYHAKTELDRKHYKVILDPGGAVRAVFREVPAEIEVPVD